MAKKDGEACEQAMLHVDIARRSFTVVPSKKVNSALQKPRRREFTQIYKNVKTQTYAVQPYVMGPISWTHFGEPTLVTQDQFESSITAAVLENLERFNKRVFDPALVRKRTEAENRRFIKDHLCVDVARLDTNEIKVSPQHRERGGYTGGEENSTLLKPEEVPQRLADAIREAFNWAT